MLVLVWISLAIAVVASTAAFVAAIRAGMRAWRDFRGFGRATAAALADLTQRLERFAEHAGSVPAHGPQLERSRAKLSLSLARLAVLRAAVDEATDVTGRFTALYPRK